MRKFTLYILLFLVGFLGMSLVRFGFYTPADVKIRLIIVFIAIVVATVAMVVDDMKNK